MNPSARHRWPLRLRRLRPLALALAHAAALVGTTTSCGGEEALDLSAPLTLPFALPVECASPPADLEAEVWVSGSRAPTPLAVNVAANTTSGTVRVTTGTERRIVIDWFVEREGTRVLLAQAAKTLDLTRPETDTIVLEISPSDVNVTTCVDVRDDLTRVGSPTTEYAGEARPVCDLDESCGGSLEPGCSNLGEVCAGGDPLREP